MCGHRHAQDVNEGIFAIIYRRFVFLYSLVGSITGGSWGG